MGYYNKQQYWINILVKKKTQMNHIITENKTRTIKKDNQITMNSRLVI